MPIKISSQNITI